MPVLVLPEGSIDMGRVFAHYGLAVLFARQPRDLSEQRTPGRVGQPRLAPRASSGSIVASDRGGQTIDARGIALIDVLHE
jgi:hypothetical protein